MTPIHKTCYRCGAAVPEFVDPADLLGGQHGMCADCRQNAAAAEALREWRIKNGEPDAGVDLPPDPEMADIRALPVGGQWGAYWKHEDGTMRLEPPAGAIPREILSPAAGAAGAET